MGPLSKLWVMIEQINSTAELDAALELLEKNSAIDWAM